MNDATIEQEIQDKGLTAPRITPADIEAEIAGEYSFTAAQATKNSPQFPALPLLTFCVLVLRNGFTVTGESACASAENFDAELGRKIARQHAVDKVWPLLGFRLRDQLSAPPAAYEEVIAEKARRAHEINRAYCAGLGDDSQLPWDQAPQWQRDSACSRSGAMMRWQKVCAQDCLIMALRWPNFSHFGIPSTPSAAAAGT